MKSVRNLCLSLLCLFAMVTACSRAGHAASNDQFVALQALNHSLMAVEIVLRHPDRTTVDAQRSAIIEQLTFPETVLRSKEKNKGKDNANALQQLYDDLTRLFRECGNDEAGLARSREAGEAAVMAALARISPQTNLVAGSARDSFKPLARGVMGNGPLGCLLALAEYPADHGALLANVVDDQAEKLDQVAIERFASLRKQLLEVRDDLVSKSRLPAREVLTDERIGLFLDLLGKARQADAISLARKHEKELSFWPPFWFHYGKIAQAKGEDGLARRCFREFERRSRSCLKKNTYQAALSLNRISMLDSGEEAEARRVLEIMNKNLTASDWPKGLVAGLQYYTLGDRRRAEQQFRRNASELKVLVPVHTRLLGLIRERKFAISALLEEAGERGENGMSATPDDHETKKQGKSPAVAQDNATEKKQEVQPDRSHDKGQKTASDIAPAGQQGRQADNAGAKPAKPEQVGQTSASPSTQATSATASGNEKTESGNDSQEPASLVVENDQDSGNDGSVPIKGTDDPGRNLLQDKAGEQRGEAQDGAKQDERQEELSVGRSANKQGKTLPATGMIGSRPGSDNSQDSPAPESGEQTGPAGQTAGSEKQESQQSSPAGTPEAAKEDRQGSGAEAGMGEHGKGDSENSQNDGQDSTANAKDAKALYLLAMSHYRGDNGKKDLVRAIQMLNQAAGQGNADAQTQLGFCHYTGNGVARDKAKAAMYFSQAAAQGNTNAMFNLAVCYFTGDGVEKDVARAVELYTTAALKGETRSQYNLAMLYYRGEGVDKDVTKARKLLESLSAQGFVPARKAMEYLDAKQESTEKPKE